MKKDLQSTYCLFEGMFRRFLFSGGHHHFCSLYRGFRVSRSNPNFGKPVLTLVVLFLIFSFFLISSCCKSKKKTKIIYENFLEKKNNLMKNAEPETNVFSPCYIIEEYMTNSSKTPL